MQKCFKKRRITPSVLTLVYNKEIRNSIQTYKTLEGSHTQLGINTRNLVKKPDKRIDKKVAQYNDKILLYNVGCGPLSNHDFWRVKKILCSKNISVPHSIFDSFKNELSDPKSIKNQFRNNLSTDLNKEKLRNPLKCMSSHRTTGVNGSLKTARK